MNTKYHVTGTVQVSYQQNGKIEEFYVDLIVDAESEVEAITIVANDLLRGHDYQHFVWQRLSIKVADGKEIQRGVRSEGQPVWKMAA